MPSLRECFDKHGCDRGKRHGYERVYGPLFDLIRDQPLRLLEIGIYRGAGLWVWLDYFPKATVFGIDTFQRVPPEAVEVLNHERVIYWQLDSTRHGVAGGQFDIIIDDGCHRAEAQLATWRNFYPLLNRGGMYFIEDVWPNGPGYRELVDALPDPIHHRLKGAFDSYILQC